MSRNRSHRKLAPKPKEQYALARATPLRQCGFTEAQVHRTERPEIIRRLVAEVKPQPKAKRVAKPKSKPKAKSLPRTKSGAEVYQFYLLQKCIECGAL
jgi:hypothetical protein